MQDGVEQIVEGLLVRADRDRVPARAGDQRQKSEAVLITQDGNIADMKCRRRALRQLLLQCGQSVRIVQAAGRNVLPAPVDLDANV